MSIPTRSVVVAWHGLPAYAARLIRQAGGEFPVIATRPVVPISGMEELLLGRIRWITDQYDGGWSGLKLAIPKLYFQPSWNTPAFNQLGDEVRRAGGRVVVMFDNPWSGSLRQWLGAVRFRTQWRDRFCAAWVCGKLGCRLARFWGFPEDRIYQGMYGADPEVFAEKGLAPLAQRQKRFLFVGRLIEAKGVLELLQAWQGFSSRNSDWELHVYGTGKHEAEVRNAGGHLIYHGFQQPEVIATAMREARYLVLPSHDEHWGLVVCEAAQAGCGLLLSNRVGSGADLVGRRNGKVFAPRNIRALAEALGHAAGQEAAALSQIEEESLALGQQFTPRRWAATFKEIVERCSSGIQASK